MSDFNECLKRRGLVRFSSAPDVVERELAAAAADLADAGTMLENGQWKWLTITGYYAMFHAARALVMREGYAEKSHYCLAVAFREIFGTTEEGRDLAAGLERARVLRENADYLSDYDETGARAALTVARRFVAFAEKHSQDG
ncbi:MAG: HEPN domain-containing protein [Anaerosomatales bacterium]